MSNRVVAVLNQKGGVGKTTTSTNLTHALARMGQKVTVIDLDPQGHLAVSLGFGMHAAKKPGIDDVMLGLSSIEEQAMKARENLKLIMAGSRLHEIEQLTEGGARRGDLLRKALHENLQDQNFVFIDCPPSSGVLVANALFAADEILIPMTSDFLSLQGLSHLMGTIRRFEKALNKKYKISLVMSRYTTTRRISKEVLNTMLKHFPNQILSTVIRETALLAECPSAGKTIHEYRPGSRSARDFRNLARDFLEYKVM